MSKCIGVSMAIHTAKKISSPFVGGQRRKTNKKGTVSNAQEIASLFTPSI
jgi:hypothetical protein